MSVAAETRAQPDTLRLEELGRMPGCVCFAWQNVTITVYTDRATLETVKMLARVGEVMRRRHERRSAVSFVLNGVAPPTEEAREPFSQLIHGAASAINVISTVLEGGGFWASALRSVTVGMKLEAGGKAELEVHDSLEEVVDWLPAVHFAETGVEIHPTRLEAVLRRARALAADG